MAQTDRSVTVESRIIRLVITAQNEIDYGSEILCALGMNLRSLRFAGCINKASVNRVADAGFVNVVSLDFQAIFAWPLDAIASRSAISPPPHQGFSGP
jgi:hypothetical protein